MITSIFLQANYQGKFEATTPKSQEKLGKEKNSTTHSNSEKYSKLTKFYSDSKSNETLEELSKKSTTSNSTYTFEGPQQYMHPDHVIRTSRKTERYSNTGKHLNHKYSLYIR